MSKYCAVKNKRPVSGHKYTRKGIAKKKGGIGLNLTGKAKRYFRPNTLRKRFWFAEEKRFISLNVSAHGLRCINKRGLAAVVADLRRDGQKV